METKDSDEAISWELNGLSGTEHVHLLPEAEFGIPVSFLNYFERSRSKAALHEELLFKDAEEGDVMGSACSEESWEKIDVTVDERESYEDVFKEHRERQRYREMEEQRRLREEEFQMELRSLIEHEKCQQTALELKEKMAQEKLEEEFVLQQELMSTFRKKVEEETQKVEEQQKRVLQERQRRKKKEEMESKKEDLRSQIQVEERQQPEEEKHFRKRDEMINKEGMLKRVEGSEKKDEKRTSEEGKEKGEKEQIFQREHKEKKKNKEEQQVMNGEKDERRVIEDNKGEPERKKAEETGRMKQEARKKMEQKRKEEESQDLKNTKLEDESEVKDTKERTEEKGESQLKRRGEEDTKKRAEVEKRVFQEMQQRKEEEIKLRKEEESKKELENLKVEDEGRMKDITENIEKENKLSEEEKKDRMSPLRRVKEEAKAVRRDQKRVSPGKQKTEEERRKLSNEEEKRRLEEDEKKIKERDELNKKEVMLKKEKIRKADQRERIEEKENLRRLEDERIRQRERNEMKEEGERMEELEQKRKEGESKMLQNKKLEDDRIIWDINGRVEEEKENVATEDEEEREEMVQMIVEEESKYMEEQQKQVLEETLRVKEEEKKGRKGNQNEEEDERRQFIEQKNIERNNAKKKEEMMREDERTKKHADERRMMKDEQGKKNEGVAQEQIFKRKETEGGNEKVKSKEEQITEEKEKRRTLENERITSEETGRRKQKEEWSERMEDLDEKSREAESKEKQRELADEMNKKEDKNKKRSEDMMDNTVRRERDEQKTPGRTKEIKEIDKTCDSTMEVYKKGKSPEKEEEGKMEGERDQLKDENVKSEEEEKRKGGEVEPVQILEKKIPVRKERRVEGNISDEGMKMEVMKESDLEIMTEESNVKSLESKEELRDSDEDQTLGQEMVLEGQVLDALSEHTAEKRLSWMKECISWSKLSVQNRRKQRCFAKKEHRRPPGVAKLPPLCADALLRSSGFKSLQEVTVLSLENLPAPGSLLTLRQCPRLQSLTIRRCQLNSLEGLNELSELRVIDAQENHISYLDCSNMSGLKVLRLNHNKLTSIHGLSGAESLAVLELSYNSITRVAGLESTRKLQILTLDHNQLISTRGLRDVYTLQHLSCSHNHLDRVEGLENCALLNRLDLRANSLIQPPSLNNHVLLRELRLDDNSISSLQGLAFGWLPMLTVLTVAQNRITDLPSMADFISLSHVDLRLNCLSEVSKVCDSLNGCQLLEEVYLEDNPLEQESCWRNTLKAAFSGLMATNKRKTDSSLSSASERRLGSASGSFLWFCQTLLRQTTDLQRRHSQELCDASPPQTVEIICRHLTETQQLAEDQRFAHEYGDLTFTVKSKARRTSEQTSPDEDKAWTRQLTWESDLTRAASPEVQCNVPSNSSDDPSQEYDMGAQEDSSLSGTLNDGLDLLPTKEGMTSAPPQTSQKNQDLKRSEAAVTSQQKCRKYVDDQCFEGQIEGEKGNPDLIILERIQGHAAMAIQACWRGFSLRRRLASALAAVKDSGEEDTFEPVDVNQFVFDEATLDHDWTLTIPDEKYHLVSESQSPKLVPLIEGSPSVLPSPPVWRPKQAWENEEHAESAEQVSAKSFNRGNRSRSPSSKSVLSGLSGASEKIVEEWGFTSSTTALLLLKRAQRMKNEKPKQGKDPAVHLGTFRNCAHQLDPIVARNMPMPHNRTCQRDWEAKFGVKQTEKETKQERALEWLQTQDNDHFLPELSLDILNGGPVQFMAEPGHTEQAHLNPRCKNTTTHRILKQSSFTHKSTLSNQRKETPPPPRRVSSAPLKRESLSFRGNPAQMSAGWGSGKKTQRLHK